MGLAISTRALAVILAGSFLLLTGCQTTYFKAMEKFGIHKRELLVDRVEEARDSQKEAKEQFRSALDHFSAVLNFKGGDLEEKYRKLSAEYEECEAKAGSVRDRIDSVEDVARALFKEWKAELEQYSNEDLRQRSEKTFHETENNYRQLIGAMKRAEKRIAPVLSAFRDQVLFLKHNLNARAIASLRSELGSIETGVSSLIRDMETSINEADAFVREMAR